VGRHGKSLGETVPDKQVISTADVCLISALCVLATGDRERIRENLLNRTSFRTSLEDSQGWMLDMIRAFMSADYGAVEVIFKSIKVSWWCSWDFVARARWSGPRAEG